MKTFMVSLLFMAAALFPILFFPLLALTLFALVASLPYFASRNFRTHHDKTLHT